MKKLFKALGAALALSIAASAANAAVIASVKVGGNNVYYNDYDILIGYGNTAAPTWFQQVAWSHATDQFDLNSGTISLDISAQFNAVASQQWWVFVDDNWLGNDSYLRSFTIDTGTKLYSAPGTPIFISDNAQVYAFIDTRDVPEPVSIALLGLGLAGMGAVRRRKG